MLSREGMVRKQAQMFKEGHENVNVNQSNIPFAMVIFNITGEQEVQTNNYKLQDLLVHGVLGL